jgi:hypothetical protein
VPVNLQELKSQIRQMGEQVKQREAVLDERRKTACQLLSQYANELVLLRGRVEKAANLDPGLRCAVPLDEPLTTHAAMPGPVQPGLQFLLASDGSQISPVRDARVDFAVINIGIIQISPNTSQPPRETTLTHLIYGDALESAQGMLSEQSLALKRDVAERRGLAAQAEHVSLPAIALTDGPLELYGAYLERMDQSDRQEFNQYLQELQRIAESGVITAGYVDRPRANLVVRMLELLLLDAERLGEAGRQHPLMGVRDADLFRPLLAPGERSAVFRLQSSSSKDYAGSIGLHFFYLNISQTEKPMLARVELPAWVAERPPALALLHATLVDQCRKMGARPYPYVLIRAHEIAVVKQEEKKYLENLIDLEIRQRGLQPGATSNKQSGKDTVSHGKRRI